MIRVALLLILLATDVRAQVHVSDGDTLRLNGTTFRLWGIDAPEISQTCANGWLAGAYAAGVLRGLVDGRLVICVPKAQDRYGRTVALCLADGMDVGAEMVRQGMAWAYRQYSLDYLNHEYFARRNDWGVHANACQPAWDYRKGRR